MPLLREIRQQPRAQLSAVLINFIRIFPEKTECKAILEIWKSIRQIFLRQRFFFLQHHNFKYGRHLILWYFIWEPSKKKSRGTSAIILSIKWTTHQILGILGKSKNLDITTLFIISLGKAKDHRYFPLKY